MNTPTEPMRIIDMIDTAAGHLAEKGFDNARMEVERLLGHVLGLGRIELYLAFERLLGEAERDRFRELYRRRLAHEPLQHIIGETGFHDITVKTDRRALVPRPETEILAEAAIEELTAQVNPLFADLGTGSGVIALSVLNAIPEAHALAIDIDPGALALAAENARLLGVEDRVTFIEGDMTAALAGQGPFDLVVSNPPYVPRGSIDGLDPEVRDHDPHRALDGGPDGLACIGAISAAAHRSLKPGGLLLIEHGGDQADAVRKLIEATGRYTDVRTMHDLAGRERVVRARMTTIDQHIVQTRRPHDRITRRR